MNLYLEVSVFFYKESQNKIKFISGYRPHFRIIGDCEYLGIQFYDDLDKKLEANKIITSKVKLIYYPGVNYSNLFEGKRFEILEGPRIVGEGIVISSLYEDV